MDYRVTARLGIPISLRHPALIGGGLALLLAACGQQTSQVLSPSPNVNQADVSSVANCSASSNTANFNFIPIRQGNTIWFTSVLKAEGVSSSAVTVNLTNGTISFEANGTKYSVPVPNFAVTFDPAATAATLSYGGGSWTETVPSTVKRDVLAGAVQFPVSTSLPGAIRNVTWTATFTSTQPSGLKLAWAWSAAVYSRFNADYTQLGVKPMDASYFNRYFNLDRAGTPEKYKFFVVPGATGYGFFDYTGRLSSTSSVTPCAIGTPPPIPTSSPFSVATQAPLPTVTPAPAGQTPQPVQITLPTSNGYGRTFTLPISSANAIAANTSAIVTLSDQAPLGTPTTLIRTRDGSIRRYDSTSQFVPIVFLELFFSGGVTLANQPPITFTFRPTIS